MIRLTELGDHVRRRPEEVYTQLAALVPSGIPTTRSTRWRGSVASRWSNGPPTCSSRIPLERIRYCYLLITFVTEYPDKKLVARVLDRHVVPHGRIGDQDSTMPLRLLLEKYDCRGMSDLTWQLMLCILPTRRIVQTRHQGQHLLVWSRGISALQARMLRLFEWTGLPYRKQMSRKQRKKYTASPFPLNEETAVQAGQNQQAAAVNRSWHPKSVTCSDSRSSIRAISSGMEIRMFNDSRIQDAPGSDADGVSHSALTFFRNSRRSWCPSKQAIWDILPLFQWTPVPWRTAARIFRFLQCAVVNCDLSVTDRLLEKRDPPPLGKVAYRAPPAARQMEHSR